VSSLGVPFPRLGRIELRKCAPGARAAHPNSEINEHAYQRDREEGKKREREEEEGVGWDERETRDMEINRRGFIGEMGC